MIKTPQKIFLILGAIVIGVGIAWYLNVYKKNQDILMPDKFTASIEPIRFLITKIVGDDFEISTLLPAGASPETYEPTTKQIVEASVSTIIFTTGLIDFENIIVDKINANSSAKTVNLSEGIELIDGTCIHEGDNGQHPDTHNHGADPHIWTSPKTLKIMAENAYKAISTLYPDSLKYKENYQELINILDQADNSINYKITSSDIKYFLIYHPALTYYSNDYNIKQMALEQDGKEPSVTYIRPIIDQAKIDSVKVILYQKHLNPSIVESIAKDINATPIEFDPMDGNVIENLLRVTDIITTQ